MKGDNEPGGEYAQSLVSRSAKIIEGKGDIVGEVGGAASKRHVRAGGRGGSETKDRSTSADTSVVLSDDKSLPSFG